MHSSSFTSEGPQEDEEIKCPKCFSFFSSLTKPYILPCNHNICLNCINSLIDEKNPKCPICSFHFNKTDKNSFEVNFTFLNIIIKILETKIIFCPQCNKIFYWKEHYKFCEQKNFQNCDNILEEIKINCEESAKILKLIKENGDLINKYKIELYNVTNNIMKEIHKKYINKVKFNIKNKLLNTKYSIDFQKVKYDMINFIKLFLPYSEYFDTNEISKIIENNNYARINNTNILCNSYSDMKNKTKALINKKNAFSPPVKNLVLSEKKYQTIISNNEISKKVNNKINKFLNNKNIRNKNTMKEIISEVKEPEEDLSLPLEVTILDDEGVNGTERVKIKKYHDNNISKFEKLNKAQADDNSNKKIINQTIDIINRENSIVKKNMFNKKTVMPINQGTHKKNKSKFDIKSLLKEDFEDEEITKNKIIIGLKDIKVVSLKQSKKNLKNPHLELNNKNKVKLIKAKLKINNKKLNIGNISNLTNNSKNQNLRGNQNNTTNNNINNKFAKTINVEGPSLSLLRSSEFSKRDYHFNLPAAKNKNKNNNINSILSFSSTNINFNNHSEISKNIEVINHSSTKENLTLRNKPKNSFYNVPQKNSPFVNDKMAKNFNKTKEITDALKKYSELMIFLYETINKKVNQNLLLLNDLIMNNYESLLCNISFKSSHTQKNFILNIIPNTYNILLFDSFNKKLVKKNLNEILQKNNINIKHFNTSNSIVFDDTDLIFISGGQYSLDLFLIISLSKEEIIYNKSTPFKRAFHKTIHMDNKLYLLGGEDSDKKVTQECYFFEIPQKKWHFFPNLKKARKNFSLCLYNESILYVFMGEDDIKVLDTIEYIDINNYNKKGWAIFKPIDMGYVWHPAKNTFAINIDKDKILICGGEDNDNNLYKDCFLIKPSNNTVYKGMDLNISAAFISEGCFSHNEIYGIDYKNSAQNHISILHKFNIENNSWNFEYINNKIS